MDATHTGFTFTDRQRSVLGLLIEREQLDAAIQQCGVWYRDGLMLHFMEFVGNPYEVDLAELKQASTQLSRAQSDVARRLVKEGMPDNMVDRCIALCRARVSGDDVFGPLIRDDIGASVVRKAGGFTFELVEAVTRNGHTYKAGDAGCIPGASGRVWWRQKCRDIHERGFASGLANDAGGFKTMNRPYIQNSTRPRSGYT